MEEEEVLPEGGGGVRERRLLREVAVERVPKRLLVDERVEAHVQAVELPLRCREDDADIGEHRQAEQQRHGGIEHRDGPPP